MIGPAYNKTSGTGLVRYNDFLVKGSFTSSSIYLNADSCINAGLYQMSDNATGIAKAGILCVFNAGLYMGSEHHFFVQLFFGNGLPQPCFRIYWYSGFSDWLRFDGSKVPNQ